MTGYVDPGGHTMRDAAMSTHACPPLGSGSMPCCGRTPFEVPRSHRMAVDMDLVTCGTSAEVRQLRERVATLEDGITRTLRDADSWTPCDSRDTGETFLVDTVRDLLAELRALLDPEVTP